jgi:hypothetical protein
MSGPERRASPRTKSPTRAVILDSEDALQQPHFGWLLDRSAGGMCLVFKQIGLKLGDKLLVELDPESENEVWFTVKVKNGRWQRNRLELGCEFVSSDVAD